MAKKAYYLVSFDFSALKDSEQLSCDMVVQANTDTDAIAVIEKLAKSAKYEVCECSGVEKVDEESYKESQKGVYLVSYDMAKSKDKNTISSERTVKAPDPFTAIANVKSQVNSAGYKVFIPSGIEKVDDDE